MTVSARTRFNGDVPRKSASQAAAAVEKDASLLLSGFGSVGYPKAVPIALANSTRDYQLTVISSGSVGDEIDTELIQSGAIERRFPYQAKHVSRAAANTGQIAFHDRHVWQLGDEVQYGGLVDPDIAIIEAIAVGEDWLIPSTSIGQTPAFVESADRLIVEVNTAQPIELQRILDIYRPGKPPDRQPIPLTAADERIGSDRIEFEPAKLEAVVETNHRDSTYSFREPTGADEALAQNLKGFIRAESKRNSVYEDTIHIQFGVGSVGNALSRSLSTVEFDCCDLVYFGEVVQDGLLNMIDAGQLDGASATSLALSKEGQTKLFADIERYADHLVLRPTDISNHPVLVDRFGVMAVNSALEVDIYGHVNSTHVNGTDLINGIGGSGDFSRNALVSIIALPSTTNNGDLSRIVPMVPHVDHTEHDIDIIITEHGVADLRGLSPVERAHAIIESCADPEYREALRKYLERGQQQNGHIPHDFETVFSELS